MSLAPPTVAELATFTGKESNSFSNFAVEALSQATLLFYIATSLTEYPESAEEARLAKYGIMDMADKIYWSQPYREAMASPYQSESIGSYSYSKMTQAVKKGDNTGVMWFDLAVGRLTAGGTGIGSNGSISGMEWEGVEVDGSGRTRIVGASGTMPTTNGAWEIDTEEVVHYHPIL